VVSEPGPEHAFAALALLRCRDRMGPVLDAITEPRPYRSICTFDDAVREMESSAGRQWSRVLVNWLLETVMAQCEGQARAG